MVTAKAFGRTNRRQAFQLLSARPMVRNVKPLFLTTRLSGGNRSEVNCVFSRVKTGSKSGEMSVFFFA